MTAISVAREVTEDVRLALNGDKAAYKRMGYLVQLPFSSLKKLYGTTEEDLYALNFLACFRLKMFKDKAALEFLTSARNPLKDKFSAIAGLVRI